jgi:hypothetical protein
MIKTPNFVSVGNVIHRILRQSLSSEKYNGQLDSEGEYLSFSGAESM